MGAQWMTIAGGVLEAIGFALIVWQLVRVQRQEFGTPEFILRWRAWINAKLQRLRRRRVGWNIRASAATSATGTTSAKGHNWMHMGPEADDRLAALEHNLAALMEWHRDKTGKLAAHIRRVEKNLSDTRNELYQWQQEQKDERAAELRASIKFEALGVAFFLSGTVLSVMGSV